MASPNQPQTTAAKRQAHRKIPLGSTKKALSPSEKMPFSHKPCALAGPAEQMHIVARARYLKKETCNQACGLIL